MVRSKLYTAGSFQNNHTKIYILRLFLKMKIKKLLFFFIMKIVEKRFLTTMNANENATKKCSTLF